MFPVWHTLTLVACWGSRQNPLHMTPDEQINNLCLEIQGETDGHKLLQLIDQLNGMLDVKEKFLGKMAKQKKPSARSRQTA